MPETPAPRANRGFSIDFRLASLFGVLVLLVIIGTITSDNFFTGSNLDTVLRLAAPSGVVAVGMTFVIIAAGIDLSVGSVIGLASVWMTTLATQSYGLVVMVICGLAVGLGAGLINGILVAYGRMVAFIATLAMYISAKGLAEFLSNKQTQVVRDQDFLAFFQGSFLGVPALVWILAIVVAAGWVLLNRTTFGRRTFAIGGNPEATRLAGINVKRHTAMVYGIAGLTAGLAAVMLVARTTAGSSTHGQFYELDAIAAVVIGGTVLTGGRGTMVGTLIGVLIFTVISNIFTQNNLSTDIQNISKGVIIVIAVLLQFRSSRARSNT
ncbi:ABC transporter permease [Kibdelosporangium philippinense]|uniref:ABC transporter permease n=1 Tax=Kibdelosporangium philippinense TaxID=211113 RepID=A0ABS8ZUW6_9PSEU|nr:ABC transporter permease [Kibdelosporangium philippinense]MCE7011483.1 ABC transporter permease [Kibdelosporangium philippinense]